MTPAFLQFEYQRPGFPADFYGLSTDERLQYAPFALDYLLNDTDITYLGDLRFPDGTPLFNARELHHMQDVKIVTRYAFGFAIILGLLMFAAGFVLQRIGWLRYAFAYGAFFTLGILLSIVIVAVLSWDFFFTGFHTLLFEQGTWYFEYSDTLIRLFPEQFWFDAALLIGGLAVVESIIILIGVRFRP